MSPPRRRSSAELVRAVERLFMHEVLTFEGEKHVNLRVEGPEAERSVFAVATLSATALVVARVYEAELDHDPARALQLVYMAREDLDLVVATVRAASTGRQGRQGSRY